MQLLCMENQLRSVYAVSKQRLGWEVGLAPDLPTLHYYKLLCRLRTKGVVIVIVMLFL